MIVKECKLLGTVLSANNMQYTIPVYQRRYAWDESNCKTLFDDIKELKGNDNTHFLGVLVYIKDKYCDAHEPECIVIDGQQRLMTMLLFLKALYELAEDDSLKSKIKAYMFNGNPSTEQYKPKMRPNAADCDFLRLDDLSGCKNPNIEKNYNFFKAEIKKYIDDPDINPETVLDAAERLRVVTIQIMEEEDDPQLVFNSLNSTGVKLKPYDMIRNYLFMNIQNSEKLYEKYWKKLESLLDNGNDLETFFFHYMTFKTGEQIKRDQVYEKFKAYTENGSGFRGCKEDVLKDLVYYAEIYKAFISDDKSYGESVADTLYYIRFLEQTTCYPFLLGVFDDYKNKCIDNKVLADTLQLIFTYLLRRMVCERSSGSLRGFFRRMYKNVFDSGIRKNTYFDSINTYLRTLDTKDAMPEDEEFKQKLTETNLYNGKVNLCHFILLDIENNFSKETVNDDKLTIEHIMPQTPNNDWDYIDPEAQKRFCHVLGNLTLTGSNSELSNNGFLKKKKIYDDSKVTILNKDVVSETVWDIGNIVSRGERLAKIVIEHYKLFDKNSNINFNGDADLTECGFDDAGKLSHKKPHYFVFDDVAHQLPKKSWRLLLLSVAKVLDERHPEKTLELAREGAYPLADTKSDKWGHEKLRERAYISTNFGSADCIKYIGLLMDMYGEDRPLFKYYIKGKFEEDEADNDDENE